MPVVNVGHLHDGLSIAFEPSPLEPLSFPEPTPVETRVGRLYVALNRALAPDAQSHDFACVRERLRDLLAATHCMTFTDEFTTPFASLEIAYEEVPQSDAVATSLWRARWRRLAERCRALLGDHVDAMLERADR
jgi:hypothetical protein